MRIKPALVKPPFQLLEVWPVSLFMLQHTEHHEPKQIAKRLCVHQLLLSVLRPMLRVIQCLHKLL
jgi:hypothetical protein